jgi:hypothetical protein
VLADLLLVRRRLRLVQQFGGHQQVQQLQGVIRLGLQQPDRGQQRRHPAPLRVTADQGGVRAHPVLGQLAQPARRHQILGTQVTHAQPHHLRDLIESLDHGGAAAARRRTLAPAFQVRDPRPGRDLQQLVQRTYRWPTVSNPSSTAHRRRVVSSRTWATSRVNVLTPGSSTSRSRSHPTASMKIAFGPSPDVHDRADIHPRRSASTAVNSFQVADPPDLPLMIEPRLAPLGVPLHTRRISDLQLLGHEVQHRQWHIQRILQKGPDPADRHQLEREPELHVLAAMTVDQRPRSSSSRKNTRSKSACDGTPRVPAVASRLYLYRRTGRQRRQPSSL